MERLQKRGRHRRAEQIPSADLEFICSGGVYSIHQFIELLSGWSAAIAAAFAAAPDLLLGARRDWMHWMGVARRVASRGDQLYAFWSWLAAFCSKSASPHAGGK
jgi:hypothetical protein